MYDRTRAIWHSYRLVASTLKIKSSHRPSVLSCWPTVRTMEDEFSFPTFSTWSLHSNLWLNLLWAHYKFILFGTLTAFDLVIILINGKSHICFRPFHFLCNLGGHESGRYDGEVRQTAYLYREETSKVCTWVLITEN